MSDVFTRINLGKAFTQSQGERSPFYFDIIVMSKTSRCSSVKEHQKSSNRIYCFFSFIYFRIIRFNVPCTFVCDSRYAIMSLSLSRCRDRFIRLIFFFCQEQSNICFLFWSDRKCDVGL